MNFEIVKIDELSGNEATIYSIIINGSRLTLFEQFIVENKNSFKNEINDIISRLHVLGSNTGARESFFKLNEGNLGDGVSALYDKPKYKLRLYCIRYGNSLLILGGGGPKPKTTKTLQNDKKLQKENFLLREISQLITKRIISKEIKYTNYGKEIIGNLIFKEDEY